MRTWMRSHVTEWSSGDTLSAREEAGLIEVMSIALKHDIRFNLFGFFNLKGDNFLLYGPRHVGHP